MPANRKLLCAVFVAAAISTLSAFGQTWVHPGIVVSPQQLQATRTAYQNNNLVVVAQVNKAMSSNYGSLTYSRRGPYSGTAQCGQNSNPDHGCSDADYDSNAAYVQALLWYITGNQTYANNAAAIMNAYATGFHGYARHRRHHVSQRGPIAPMARCNRVGTLRNGRVPQRFSTTAQPPRAPAPDGQRRTSMPSNR